MPRQLLLLLLQCRRPPALLPNIYIYIISIYVHLKKKGISQSYTDGSKITGDTNTHAQGTDLEEAGIL